MAAGNNEKPAGQGQLELDPETPPWLQPISEDLGDAPKKRISIKLMFGIAIVLVGAFAGGLFYVQRGSDVNGPPLVARAPDSPVRVKPAAPGGLEVAHQDIEVLNAAPGLEEPAVLASPPEQPMDSLDSAIEAADAATDAAIDVATDASLTDVQMTSPTDSMPTSSLTSPPTPRPTPKPTPSVDEAEKPISAPASPPAATTSTDPTPEPERAAVLPPQGPNWRLQLGAFGSRAAAAAAWTRARATASEELRGLEPSYEPVTLSERTLLRLRTGSFANRAGADALCTALKDKGMACLVINP